MKKCFSLIVKKQWYDMELSLEKKEEYREIKPYYTSRLCKLWCENYLHVQYKKARQKDFIEWLESKGTIDLGRVFFRNGYSARSRSFVADCTLRIGSGKIEWGAQLEKEYYVFGIKSMMIINE
jgi:hypothetical protein